MEETKEINDVKGVKVPGIELNEQFLKAVELLEKTLQNVFITGRAGTGKSTFLQYFRDHTRKNVVVLAPTGVAAIHIKGQTIHSFFNFKPDTTADSVASIRLSKNKIKLLETVTTIVIDEISMVRCDLMDCIDAMLKLYGNKEKPFGGVQMVFIGDLFQLPPVVRMNERSIFESVYKSPYFFDAKVFKNLPLDFIEFETHYRQHDLHFIELLNAIRNNTLEEEQLRHLNTRYQQKIELKPEAFYIYLTTTNDLADQLNYARLHEIKEELHSLEGEITGQFDQKNLPTHNNLEIKVGAQVMMLNNDQARRWVNGSIGKVISIDKDPHTETTIRVELTNGKRVDVAPHIWEICHFFYNEEKSALDSEVVGAFRQYPLKPAWAVTIHKSQGKTFDNVIIDFGRGTFSHGQTYVALSRCTTLEGIILKRPLSRRDVFIDPRIPEFLINFQYHLAQRDLPDERKMELFEHAIRERQTVEIVYLKEKGERHRRKVQPKGIRRIEHLGQKCWGLEAFCLERQQDWIFRFPCIVEIK